MLSPRFDLLLFALAACLQVVGWMAAAAAVWFMITPEPAPMTPDFTSAWEPGDEGKT